MGINVVPKVLDKMSATRMNALEELKKIIG